MNDQQKSKIIVRNAILWGFAFITPPIVMVIVDATTRETPSQNAIALFSSFALMGLFVIGNAMLSSGLNSLAESDESGDESKKEA